MSLTLAGLLPQVAQAEQRVPGQSGVTVSADARPERFDFGTLGIGEPLEHTFSFQNTGQAPLQIKNVQLSPPLIATKMTPRVDPGAEGRITVRLRTPREVGEFKGQVLVNFEDDGVKPMAFSVIGEIVPSIQFDPAPAFFVAGQRGSSTEASIEIINHEKDPLEILRVENPSSKFSIDLETLAAGKHYRVILKLNPEAPAGKSTDTITLVTSSREHPFLDIQANTLIKERVYTFPDTLDFGRIQIQQLKAGPQWNSLLSETLMVYQVGGKDFQISARTDVPFLSISPVQSKFKDRYQIEVNVVPERLKSGVVQGYIFITTNDPQFLQLAVPVKAVVEGAW